jgi:hypothetical protein
MWGWSIVSVVMIFVGLILCVVPGLYFMVALSLFSFAVIFERGTVQIGRSFQLVNNNFGAALGRVALLSRMYIVISLVVSCISGVIIGVLGMSASSRARPVERRRCRPEPRLAARQHAAPAGGRPPAGVLPAGGPDDHLHPAAVQRGPALHPAAVGRGERIVTHSPPHATEMRPPVPQESYPGRGPTGHVPTTGYQLPPAYGQYAQPFHPGPYDPLVPEPGSPFEAWWSRVFATFRGNVGQLSVIFLVAALPASRSVSGLPPRARELVHPVRRAGSRRSTSSLLSFFGGLMVFLIITYFLSSVAWAAGIHAVTARAAGQQVTLGGALRAGLRRAAPMWAGIWWPV